MNQFLSIAFSLVLGLVFALVLDKHQNKEVNRLKEEMIRDNIMDEEEIRQLKITRICAINFKHSDRYIEFPSMRSVEVCNDLPEINDDIRSIAKTLKRSVISDRRTAAAASNYGMNYRIGYIDTLELTLVNPVIKPHEDNSTQFCKYSSDENAPVRIVYNQRKFIKVDTVEFPSLKHIREHVFSGEMACIVLYVLEKMNAQYT